MKTASFDWGNEVLYRMCRETPDHRDLSAIVGKIWLIGRSYSAAIERKAGPSKRGQNIYLHRVAPIVLASNLDKWLSRVNDIRRVTEKNVELVIECHSLLTDLFREITGIEKRSLASKYLHFHVPSAFFIFDSRANLKIRRETTGRYGAGAGLEHRDPPYASFCYRSLELRAILERKTGKKLSPRDLDKHLLRY